MKYFILYLSVFLICHVSGEYYLGKLINKDKQLDDIDHFESSTASTTSDELSDQDSGASDLRSQQENSSINGSNPETGQSDANESRSESSVNSTSGVNSAPVTIILSGHEEEISTPKGSFNNGLTSNYSDERHSHKPTESAKSQSVNKSTPMIETPSSESNGSSSPGETNEESEGVVLIVNNKPFLLANGTTPGLKTLYQRTLELITDTYTLSIIVPVAAGIVFASSIIITVATCRCIRRRCKRKRFRKKVLPDSVKSLRPSDHARLLAESSDEEF